MRLEFAPEHRIDLATAKQRALDCLLKQGRDIRARRIPIPAASVAGIIWPDNPMQPQGAGGAASRILNHLKREGKARWTCITHSGGSQQWGWIAEDVDAFAMGADAAASGVPETENPFPIASDEHLSWNDGFASPEE